MITNRIAIDPKIFGGKPCIRGTRITVTTILELIEDGLTFQQIIGDYYHNYPSRTSRPAWSMHAQLSKVKTFILWMKNHWRHEYLCR